LDAVWYQMLTGASYDAVIRAYDDAGNVIETHEHKGDQRVLKKFRRPSLERKKRMAALTATRKLCGCARGWQENSEPGAKLTNRS
jgi:hypothetical protein